MEARLPASATGPANTLGELNMTNDCPIDTSKMKPVGSIHGENVEDTKLLKEMARRRLAILYLRTNSVTALTVCTWRTE